MQYRTLINLLRAFVQNWGAQFEDDAIEPLVKYVCIPEIARSCLWRSLRKPYTKTLTVGTGTYDLPYDFKKFIHLKNKYGFITFKSVADFNAMFPDRSSNNLQDSNIVTIQEFEGVKNQIATAETLSVVSSDASDTETVLIRGEVANYDDYEEVTLNGTTAVTTTKTFTSISQVTKSDVTTGYVTVSGSTSSTTFSVVPAEHLQATYKRMIFSGSPQEALELVGEYEISNITPIRDYDKFKVPADLVFLSALSFLGWERRDAQLQALMEEKMRNELGKAINKDILSHAIESKMELANEQRKNIPDDYPLSDY